MRKIDLVHWKDTDLDNAEGGGGDRVGEVSARGRDSSDNAHTSLSLRVACMMDTGQTAVSLGGNEEN